MGLERPRMRKRFNGTTVWTAEFTKGSRGRRDFGPRIPSIAEPDRPVSCRPVPLACLVASGTHLTPSTGHAEDADARDCMVTIELPLRGAYRNSTNEDCGHPRERFTSG